jgi:hypothetical protein
MTTSSTISGVRALSICVKVAAADFFSFLPPS